MSEFLYHYNPVDPATWFYLSSLLMIGLFFKFGRVWSVRNLDLVLLILLAPGLLFIHYGSEMVLKDDSSVQSSVRGEADAANVTVDSESTTDEANDQSATAKRAQRYGYYWQFGIGLIWLIRMLADPLMVRRPLLEPNLTGGGLTFIGCSLFVFLMANVINKSPEPEATMAVSNSAEEAGAPKTPQAGPGYRHFVNLPIGARKMLSITAHLAVVASMVLIGYRHFDNIVMGVGAATLYLMLPYTSVMTNRVQHVLPAALIVSALLCYRRPLAAGTLLGLAGGLAYYPLFLLPLWLSFYWSRGLYRFLTSYGLTLVVLTTALLISSTDHFGDFCWMYGFRWPAMEGLGGIWSPDLGGWSPFYRLPVIAAFAVLAIGLAIWPAQKNFGSLLSCTSAVMIGTQFWHGFGGGTFIAWYIPMLLLTTFRPNLEDRVALSVIPKSPFEKKREPAIAA
ncbi:MAG: hypothetical protein KDB27_36105 [Planctomycetales bacterium]|nr:hypothetical protein [Planctomycetales bacterium]